MPSSDKLINEDGKSLDLLVPAAKATKESTTNTRRKIFETLCNMAPSPPTVGQQKPSATVPMEGSKQTSTNKTTQKQKQKIVVPPIFQVADAKLRDHAYAMQAIENKILQKRQNDVSVNNLAWYIVNTKPHFGHMKAQLNIDCQTIQKESTKEMFKISKEMVDATEMGLPKLATIECNKLNNTPFKIMQELKTVETTQHKRKELHNHCAKMLNPMSRWSTQFITTAELDRKLELNLGQTASTIDLCMDHIQQLLHPLRNAIESLQQGVDPMVGQVQNLQANIDRIQTPTPTTAMSTDQILQELHALCQESQSNRVTMVQQQQQIQKIQETYVACVQKMGHDNQIAELKQNLTELQQQVRDLKDTLDMSKSQASPKRNPLFPQVDPTTIPSHGHSMNRTAAQVNRSTTHFNPPIPSAARKATPTILPFGSRETIQHAGTSVECWIHKCYRNRHGIKYEVSRSNGEHITFLWESIIYRDTNATPTKVPDNYIVDILGGTVEQSTPTAATHVPS